MTTLKTDVDLEKAIDWLEEHWTGQQACPICQHDRWGMAEMVGEVRQMLPDQPSQNRATYPLVIITCQTCGYAVLFNAVIIGLLKGGKAK